MSVYTVGGASVDSIFDVPGASKDIGYDWSGNVVFETGSGDYDVWTTDYEHKILQARDAWVAAYRNDPSVIPFVLTTDQHTYFNNTTKGKAYGYALYKYLSKAVKWGEVSSSLNLGDVVGSSYSAASLDSMLNVLSVIPADRQINIPGNHDVDGIRDNAETMGIVFTYYFNNDAYNGFSRFGKRGFETMIDARRHLRYVTVGSWDYLPGASMASYRISPEDMDWLIQTLEIQDDNDVVILSHIQPSSGTIQSLYPPPERGEWRVQYSSSNAVDGSVKMQNLFLARRNKTSGSIVDTDGNTHTFDFSGCTSDLLCTLHGHSHTDWCNWECGSPAIVFDSYAQDNLGQAPFFFGNIDRTNRCVNIWKVGRIGSYTSQSPDGIIYPYTVSFDKPALNPVSGIHFPADKKEITLHVGETIRVVPEYDTEYPNDGSVYPRWYTNQYTVRANGAVSQTYVGASGQGIDGVDITGKKVGTSVVWVRLGSLSDTCNVTVIEAEEN